MNLPREASQLREVTNRWFPLLADAVIAAFSGECAADSSSARRDSNRALTVILNRLRVAHGFERALRLPLTLVRDYTAKLRHLSAARADDFTRKLQATAANYIQHLADLRVLFCLLALDEGKPTATCARVADHFYREYRALVASYLWSAGGPDETLPPRMRRLLLGAPPPPPERLSGGDAAGACSAPWRPPPPSGASASEASGDLADSAEAPRRRPPPSGADALEEPSGPAEAPSDLAEALRPPPPPSGAGAVEAPSDPAGPALWARGGFESKAASRSLGAGTLAGGAKAPRGELTSPALDEAAERSAARTVQSHPVGLPLGAPDPAPPQHQPIRWYQLSGFREFIRSRTIIPDHGPLAGVRLVPLKFNGNKTLVSTPDGAQKYISTTDTPIVWE